MYLDSVLVWKRVKRGCGKGRERGGGGADVGGLMCEGVICFHRYLCERGDLFGRYASVGDREGWV